MAIKGHSCRMLLVFFILALIFCSSTTTAKKSSKKKKEVKSPRICVIGAGISGAATAFFLSKLQPSPIITVFERQDVVGGRIQSLDPDVCGEPESKIVETGAAIIASQNKFMKYFTRILNLTEKPISNTDEQFNTSPRMGLWNGKDFVFKLSSSSILSTIQSVLRYKLSLLRSRRYIKSLVDRYSTSFNPEALANWKGAKTVQDLLQQPGLYNLSQSSFESYMTDNLSFSKVYIDEIVSAVTRSNYGQDITNMNALAGAVALAGAADDLWSVAEGNKKIVEGLLTLSGAQIKFHSFVTYVHINTKKKDRKNGDYEVTRLVTNEGIKNHEEDSRFDRQFCDGVVIATPVEVSQLSFSPELTEILLVGRKFQQTVATFIRGYLRKETFSTTTGNSNTEKTNTTKDTTKVPTSAVLTIANTSDVFTSISKKCEASGDHAPLWKVFSKEKLTQDDIDRIFEKDSNKVSEKVWKAYPKFNPQEKFAPFDIDEKHRALFYTSPLESAGSSMEMSAVSAANVVALIRDRFGLKMRSEESEEAKTEL